jgi:hypothetical protein
VGARRLWCRALWRAADSCASSTGPCSMSAVRCRRGYCSVHSCVGKAIDVDTAARSASSSFTPSRSVRTRSAAMPGRARESRREEPSRLRPKRAPSHRPNPRAHGDRWTAIDILRRCDEDFECRKHIEAPSSHPPLGTESRWPPRAMIFRMHRASDPMLPAES